MPKKTLTIFMIVAMTTAVLVAGCSDDSATIPSTTENQGEILTTEELKSELSRIPVGDPSEVEITDLQFMREEEKLAHDVYVEMFDQYGLNIFENIAISEQKHTDAIKILIDRFGLEDSVGDNGPGEFTDEILQALYDELIDSGSQSVTEALLVGLKIEEVDILDIEEAMHRADLPEILMVYGNLMMGSENHLRAFVKIYENQTGETYVPRWLSQEAYDEILAEDSGRGRRGQP